MPSGFMERYKGKGFQPSGWLQQIGSGGAATQGGGVINSTASVTASSAGIAYSSGNTAEQTLLSYVVPPKTLDRIGRSLYITAAGTFSTFNNGQKTARLYFGSEAVAVGVSTAATPSTPVGWQITMNVFAMNAASSAAAVQFISGQSVGSTTHQGTTFQQGNENTLAASTVKVTGISSASTAAGDVIAYALQVEGLN